MVYPFLSNAEIEQCGLPRRLDPIVRASFPETMYLFLKTIERSFSKINDACLTITSPFVESYRSWVVRESIEADGRVSVGFGMLLGKVHQSG